MTYTVRTDRGPHRGPRQALRRDRGAERPRPRRSSRARCSACSATTAPARPPPSASSPRCSPPPPAARSSPATTSSREPGAVREQIALAGQQASLDERLTGRENLMLLGRLQRLSKARRDRAHERAARALRHHPRRRPPGRHLLRRHAPPARPRRLPGRPPPGRLPRRADHRARPGQPGRDVGRDRAASSRTAPRCC